MIKISFLFCIFLFAAGLIKSQSSVQGIISGVVTDNKGKPIDYVSVTIQNLGLKTYSDTKGKYFFPDINKGKYTLTFKRNGYESKSLEVTVSNKDTSRVVVLNESLIETPVIDITSSFNVTDISKSTFSVTELNSRDLKKQKSQNLSETIQNIPGINNISTGVSLGKPVIRGLSFQSVLIVHDGVKHESQMWGDEHGPELSLFDLDRIEILRGPASLVFGADAIGGVVNVISKPLEFSNNRKAILYGEAELGGFSMNNQGFGNLILGLSSKNLGIKGHFGYRKSGNTITPDGTLDVNTLSGKRTITGGELFNSGSKEFQGGATFGFNDKFGDINLGFEIINREIQMHDDPEENPNATGNQMLNTNQFSMQSVFNISKKVKLEPILAYQMQERKEFESIEDKDVNITALDLKINTFDGNLNVHHELTKNISGTFGAAFTNQHNESIAEEKLIPNYDANTFGVYLMEKMNTKYLTFSLGGRFDSKKLSVKQTVFEVDSLGNPVRTLFPQDITFNAVTGSFGLVYTPIKNINIYSNLGRGWRPPSEFELFVDGVHEGTRRYEKGLKTLDSLYEPRPEESMNIDLGIRLNYAFISIQLSGYRNRVSNFVYPSPTTDTLEGYQVYDVKQDKSTFIGYEYSIQVQPVKWLVLSASGDYVNTKNEATGKPLPFTPPMKNIFEVKLQKTKIGRFYNPYIKFGTKVVSAQNDVDPLETSTAGYTLLNAGLGFDITLMKSIASMDFSVDNIADTKYVDHLSRYKSFALSPGRSFNLQLSVPFRF